MTACAITYSSAVTYSSARNLLKHCNIYSSMQSRHETQGSTHLLNAFTRRGSKTCGYHEALHYLSLDQGKFELLLVNVAFGLRRVRERERERGREKYC